MLLAVAEQETRIGAGRARSRGRQSPDREAMDGPKNILIVGADPGLRESLVHALESGGAFSVTDAAGVAEAMARTQLRQQRLDAIVVQAALADGDGTELCSRLRRRGLRVPIIVLSDAHAEQEVVRALDAGANDYVVKPFRLAELKARLRAQIVPPACRFRASPCCRRSGDTAPAHARTRWKPTSTGCGVRSSPTPRIPASS
jgi:PleD family two-component response regulator